MSGMATLMRRLESVVGCGEELSWLIDEVLSAVRLEGARGSDALDLTDDGMYWAEERDKERFTYASLRLSETEALLKEGLAESRPIDAIVHQGDLLLVKALSGVLSKPPRIEASMKALDERDSLLRLPRGVRITKSLDQAASPSVNQSGKWDFHFELDGRPDPVWVQGLGGAIAGLSVRLVMNRLILTCDPSELQESVDLLKVAMKQADDHWASVVLQAPTIQASLQKLRL